MEHLKCSSCKEQNVPWLFVWLRRGWLEVLPWGESGLYLCAPIPVSQENGASRGIALFQAPGYWVDFRSNICTYAGRHSLQEHYSAFTLFLLPAPNLLQNHLLLKQAPLSQPAVPPAPLLQQQGHTLVALLSPRPRRAPSVVWVLCEGFLKTHLNITEGYWMALHSINIVRNSIHFWGFAE